MAARDHAEGAARAVGARHRDAARETAADVGVPALPAVLVPRQVRQTAHDPERLDEPFAAALVLMAVAGERADPLVAVALDERTQRGRLLVEEQHAHGLRDALVVGGPPRLAVVRRRACDPLVDVGA